jgi:hypothetical protein
MLGQVDKAIATLVAARDTVKGACWEDADRLLTELQRLIHSVRLDIRDERLPIDPAIFRRDE